MTTIWVKEVKAGLDARRLPETTPGGVLILGQDGHINRGGEFEQRAAFVPTYTLPAGTVSLGNDANGIYVFGEGAAPAGIPVGVTYQRLQNGSNTLNRVKSFDIYAGLIYAVGEFSDGSVKHFYNGNAVADWVDGRARASFQVTGGSGTSTISVAVNGVSIMSGPVTWATSHSATASAIASAINSFVSSPDYTATATNDIVSIVAAAAGTANNNLAVAFTLANGFTVSPSTGLVLSGGLDGTLPAPGSYVKTFGRKIHAVAGPLEVFSGIDTPTNWSTATGYGFVDMSKQTSNMENLTSLAEYVDKVAVFSERVVQTWTFVADPFGSVKGQTLRNTGTASPRSVVKFGESDVFYLDESGIRSLRARDASNAASINDVGVLVDPLVTAKLRSLSALERVNQVIGLIEPVDGRLWMIMKDVIYVFSYFPGSKISAWTTYTPHYFDANGNRVDFTIDDAVVWNRRVYLRSGSTIFVYGGLSTGQQHDQAQAKCWLPYLDGEKPAVKKRWKSLDAAVSGRWSVYAAMNLADTTVSDPIATLFRTTYNDENIGALGESTHISLRFESSGVGPHIFSACAIHYDSDEKPAP